MQALRPRSTYRERLQAALHETGLPLMPLEPTVGPQVVRIPVPLCDLKLADLTRRDADIAIRLAVPGVIIEQLEGTTLAAIQIARPQNEREIIAWRRVVESPQFANSNAALPLGIGVDIEGHVIVRDLATAPHAIIAGQTGGGKSNASTSMLCALITARSPAEVRLIILDPKATDFTPFAGLPHLIDDIYDTPESGVEVLERLTDEMMARNRLFKSLGPRNLGEYNRLAQKSQRLPYIVVFVDELQQLMITSNKEVAQPLQQLLQMGRSAGIHVMIATQYPKADVIPSELTINAPSRFAFAVSKSSASQVILDESGAENLLGRGDMLVRWGDGSRLIRMQAPNLEYEELVEVLDNIRKIYDRPQSSGWLEPLDEEPTGAALNLTPLPSRKITNRSAPADPQADSDQASADTLDAWIRTHGHTEITQSMVTGASDLSIGWRVYPRIRDILIERGVISEYDASAKCHHVLSSDAGLEPEEGF